MDIDDDILKRIKNFCFENRVQLVFISIGFIFITLALMIAFKGNKSGGNEVTIVTDENNPHDSIKQEKKVYVSFEGAVVKPDVYELPQGTRLKEALQIAGGLSGKADRKLFSQNFNQAQILVDQQKIYVPELGESQVTGSVIGSSTQANNPLISINNASQKDLESLPRIGPVTAKKIIDSRPYQSINDLVTKKAVGAATFEKIQSQLTL